MDLEKAIILTEFGVSMEEWVQFQGDTQLGKRLLLASVALLAYHCILTMDQEWAFLWSRRPWISWTKILFIIIRYLSLLGLVIRWIYQEYQTRSSPVGTFQSDRDSLLTLFEAMFVGSNHWVDGNLVLILRVWILYERSRVLGILLCILFILCLATALAIRALQPPVPLPFVETSPLSLTLCPISKPQQYFLEGVVGLFAETTAFVLLVGRACKTRASLTGTSIFRTLLAHGTVYYGIITIMLSLNIAATMVQKLYLPILNSNIVLATSSITCSHLILSLKASSQDDVETSEEARTQSEAPPFHSRSPRAPAVTNYYDSSVSRNFRLSSRGPKPPSLFSKNTV